VPALVMEAWVDLVDLVVGLVVSVNVPEEHGACTHGGGHEAQHVVNEICVCACVHRVRCIESGMQLCEESVAGL
jgi:hypothetical protein